MKLRICLFSAAIAGLLASSAQAAVLYSGGLYSQSFDTLPNTPENVSLGASPIGWTNDNAAPGAGNFSILGWHLFHTATLAEGGFNGNQRMRIGAGTANTGAFMSYGASTSTDRALGSLASNTTAPAAVVGPPAVPAGVIYLGAKLTNNTSNVLTEFTLTYNGEQWRNAGASGTPPVGPAGEKLLFDYSLAATAIQTGAYTAVPALDFTAPVTAPNAALNGNLAGGGGGRVNGISATITGISWAPGADLWLRWNDANNAGDDDGLAIDDVSFSARRPGVPEPGTFVLAGIGALASILVSRRRA